jgi:molybdopterin-guanine dinucleotide biosynthesis protein A
MDVRLRQRISQLHAFILAGGESRRMGTDKSRLRIENDTFIDRIAATVAPLTDSITLVGARYSHPHFPSVSDVYPRWGALGGLHAALAACEREWAIVVACDLPFVTFELFELLASLRANHDAVVPLQPDGRPQPLAALYRAVLCRERAAELIQTGHRRPLDLLQLVNTRWVPFTELTNLPQAEKFFVNINTPGDYDEATARETLR